MHTRSRRASLTGFKAFSSENWKWKISFSSYNNNKKNQIGMCEVSKVIANFLSIYAHQEVKTQKNEKKTISIFFYWETLLSADFLCKVFKLFAHTPELSSNIPINNENPLDNPILMIFLLF